MRESEGAAGFSIIGALVALATLSIAVGIANSMFKNNLQARKKLVGSTSAVDLESSVKASIADSYGKFVGSSCNPLQLPIISQIRVGVSTGLAVADTITVPADAPADVQAGAARCNDPMLNGDLNAAAGKFFRCYKVTYSAGFKASAEKGSASAADGSFVEVYGVIKDFQTGQQSLCSAVTSGLGSSGIQLFYQIHWAFKNGLEDNFTTKNGALNVSL
jgi:hypothetical protein